MNELQYYVDRAGREVLTEWLSQLNDDRAVARIAARIQRIAQGNFGDVKTLRDGVRELRVHYGPGYRVYFAMIGRRCVLLLCGADKRRQPADIARAVEYLQDYTTRHK